MLSNFQFLDLTLKFNGLLNIMSLILHKIGCLHHWLKNILIEVLIEPLKLFIFPNVAYSLRLLLDLLGNLKQLLLSFLGYDPGAPDGIDGEKTQSTVRLFQAREGLREDGIAGSKTQERLLDAVAQGRMYTRTEPKAENGTGDFWKDIRYFSRNEPYIACSCGSCGPSRALRRYSSARASALTSL